MGITEKMERQISLFSLPTGSKELSSFRLRMIQKLRGGNGVR